MDRESIIDSRVEPWVADPSSDSHTFVTGFLEGIFFIRWMVCTCLTRTNTVESSADSP